MNTIDELIEQIIESDNDFWTIIDKRWIHTYIQFYEKEFEWMFEASIEKYRQNGYTVKEIKYDVYEITKK